MVVSAFGLLGLALLAMSALTCGAFVVAGCRQPLAAARQACDDREPEATPPMLGRSPVACTMLHVATEAREVLELLAPEQTRHLVQFELAAPPGLAVHFDRQAFRAVLTGLARHAVRQAPGGRVLVSAARLGGRIQIAVIDDGAGFAASKHESALCDVARLVALHGGTLEIESVAGQGTAVIVWLPELANNDEKPASPVPLPMEPRATPASDGGEMLVEGLCDA